MRRSRPVFLLLLAAAACDPATPVAENKAEAPAQAAPPEAARTAEPSAQVESLGGAWRVAGIDGGSFDEPVGLSLTGDAQQLWWEPRCAGVARSYRIEGQRITFVARPGAGGPVCDIGQPPRLDEVVRALDGADSISRTPNNGVLISGPEHSVLLFSQ